MMRSLYSGITGLTNHQTRMDVIGNNIANVNTVGYKSSRTTFQDLYSQTLSAGSSNTGDATATTGLGGTNPKQIGLGVTLSTIDVLFEPGAAQYTGRGKDVCINDDGFFVISDGTSTYYTRAGNFYEDDAHYLVDSNGNFVQCYTVNTTTGLPTTTVEDKLLLNPAYTNFNIGENGLITAVDASDNVVNVAYIMVATFPNVNGLMKAGSNYYRETAASGEARETTPGVGGAGQLTPGALEMSNVNLANEFVDMIVTQRGFQANSRVITTSDTMLEELINLKR